MYRAALRVVTGLPRHTRIDELYRYARLPPLRELINDRRKGAADRRQNTLQGQRLLLHEDPQMQAVLEDVPPHIPPWQDIQITDLKPLSRKTNVQKYAQQRKTIAQALNAHKPDPEELRIHTDCSWDPETRIAAMAARREDGAHRSERFLLEETPSTTELELRAIHLSLLWVLEFLSTDGTKQVQRIRVLTDSATALKNLVGPPRVTSTEYAIKQTCRELQRDRNIDVKVLWVPGHSGNTGNETVHKLASEARSPHHSQLELTPLKALSHSPEEKRRRNKLERSKELLTHVPPLEDPLPKGLPRGAQVFVVKARSGFAVTEDVVARWNHAQKYSKQPNPPPFSPPQCSVCLAAQPANMRHLVWDCEGLKDARDKHRPSSVSTYEDWIRPTHDHKRILLSLWTFACEASIVRRT